MNWKTFDHKAFVQERSGVLIAQAVEGFRQMGRGFIEIDMSSAKRIGGQDWEIEAGYICAADVGPELSSMPELKRIVDIYNPACETVFLIHVPGNGAFSFRLQCSKDYADAFSEIPEMTLGLAAIQDAVSGPRSYLAKEGKQSMSKDAQMTLPKELLTGDHRAQQKSRFEKRGWTEKQAYFQVAYEFQPATAKAWENYSRHGRGVLVFDFLLAKWNPDFESWYVPCEYMAEGDLKTSPRKDWPIADAIKLIQSYNPEREILTMQITHDGTFVTKWEALEKPSAVHKRCIGYEVGIFTEVDEGSSQ
jgi:hypothetical protein